MSIKTDIFRVLMPQPLTTHQFLIVYPTLLGNRISLIAETATYPQIKMGEVAIPYKGEVVYRPTGRPVSPETWKVRVPEDSLFTCRETAIKMQSRVDREGEFWTGAKTVTVYVLNPFSVPLPAFRLKGCWLKGRDSVTMDNSDPTNPWKWNLEFRYSVVEELSLIQFANIVK